jgi:hypothetical protein
MCFPVCRFPGKAVGVNLPGAGAAAAPAAEAAKVCSSSSIPLLQFSITYASGWRQLRRN